MTVLYVDPFFLPDFVGGAQRSLLAIMLTMRHSGHEILLATPGKGLLAKKAQEMGIATVRFQLPALKETRTIHPDRNRFSILAAFYDGLMLSIAGLSLLKLIKKTKPDIVHANQMLISIPCGLASTIAGTPCVWHLRENPSSYVPGSIKWIYGLLAYLFSKRIIVNSQFSADLFKGTPALEKVRVTHIGIEAPAPLNHTRDKLINSDSPESEKVISIFGRVIPMKGHAVLIRSLKQLKENKVPKFKLKIYGFYDQEDPYYLSLRSLIQELNLQHEIEFCGFVPDIDLAMRASNMIIAPSIESESFGRTLIEAMAAGKPVIATRIGAHPEIVADGKTGFLVQPDDPGELSSAMEKLLLDVDLAESMGAAGKKVYLENFTLKNYHQKLADLYSELMNG